MTLCTVYCVLCAVCCVLCAVCCVLCAVCCVLCTVHCVLCTVYCVVLWLYTTSVIPYQCSSQAILVYSVDMSNSEGVGADLPSYVETGTHTFIYAN